MVRRRVAATAGYTVQFGEAPAKVPKPGRVPRVARLLALAHRIHVMVRDGEFRDRWARQLATLGPAARPLPTISCWFFS